MSLKNKRILITAGPTWVPIDKVRVISNVATGQTGIILANKASRRGAKVTLLLGPVANGTLDKSVKKIHFSFFFELERKVSQELKQRHYDIIIHSAAVADFRPERQSHNKISSDRIHNLKLIPLPKIIQKIACIAKSARIVIFKLESGVADKTLIQRAIMARKKAGASLVVANRIAPYRAFIIDAQNRIAQARSKGALADKLLQILNQHQILT